MSYLSVYFSDAELACRCFRSFHLGDDGVMSCTDELKQSLDDYRQYVGEPVLVHDAFRCSLHNRDVGGVPNSEHPRGLAADISVPGMSLQQMYDAAKFIPYFRNGGIGVYSSDFIHVDVRARPARWAQVVQAGKRVYVGLEESQLVNV